MGHSAESSHKDIACSLKMINFHANCCPLSRLAFFISIVDYKHPVHGVQRCIERLQQLSDEATALGAAELIVYLKSCINFGIAHEAVIKQYGRFPHRNALLGRANKLDEERGLSEGSIPRF